MTKIFTIFKRDKTGFSNEELEWQVKWKHIIVYVWLVIIIALWIAIAKFIIPYTRSMNQATIDYIAIGSVGICVALFVLVKQNVLDKISYNALNQLEKNLERQKNEKILSCIKKQKNSELICYDYEFFQTVFQRGVKSGAIRMIPFDEHVEVLIANDEQPPLRLSNYNLSYYFSLNKDEDE